MIGRSRKREEVLVSPKLMPLGVSSSHALFSEQKANGVRLVEVNRNLVLRVERHNDSFLKLNEVQVTGLLVLEK